MKYLPEKSVKKLLKTMLYSNKPVYLAADTERRPHNDNDDDDRTDPNLTYHIKELKDYIFHNKIYLQNSSWLNMRFRISKFFV